MNEIQEQVTEDWITSHDCCQILGCTYWHFVRKVLPKLEKTWQPSGKYGMRFFKRTEVMTHAVVLL